MLITREVLHFLNKSRAKKNYSIAIKIDISKAYNILEWYFIEAVLRRLGFHDKWVRWTMLCISTVSYTFLVNGARRGAVLHSRGDRQRDPFSSYIFILCTKVLSGLCTKAHENCYLHGLRVSKRDPSINHLLFVDDTMFFCKTNDKAYLALKYILHKYESTSSQKINGHKSSISFSRKTPDSKRQRAKDLLRIEKEGGIGKYLGVAELFGHKHAGILGFLDLQQFNVALVTKLSWRIINKQSSLLTKILPRKYWHAFNFMKVSCS